VHLVFDIFQGIGVAAAVGIRPFLPTLAVGALAAGSIQIDFKHTDYDFLQSAPFLLGIAVAAIVLALAERRINTERREVAIPLGAIAIVLGAVLFAGSLCRGHYVVWPGFVGGVICATVGIAATRPLLNRVRTRLDEATKAMLPLFAEGAALLFGALSIIAPPVGPVVLALLLWLLLAGRRREGQKYAGLRILR
jgi:uncharacterized membrane protein YgdD (TMEM256/DUF423 family)